MEFARGFGVDLPIERYPPFDYSAFSEWFEGFKQILDRHVIAIQVRRHIKTDPGVVDGLYLSPHYRDEIHGLLNRIRKIVNAADLPEDKKNAIYDKIASLQAEVDRSKTRFHVVLSYLLA